jgi:hypothetical protein
MNGARQVIQSCSTYFGARFGLLKFGPFCTVEHPTTKNVCAFKAFRRKVTIDSEEWWPVSVRDACSGRRDFFQVALRNNAIIGAFAAQRRSTNGSR